MKIVVDINHPAHVHYFRYFIQELRNNGNEVLVTASEKDVTFKLLEKYQLEFISVGSYGASLIHKIFKAPFMDIEYFLCVKAFKPDILIGAGSIRAAHASFLLGKPCINFEDTENSSEQIKLYLPFVQAVCTPSCFLKNLGQKQIRFKSYLELASLHPNRFKPNPDVIAEIGLMENDPFIIVRFVSWQASHDLGQHGITNKLELIRELDKYGRVLITSEAHLPDELVHYRNPISPDKMHDLLYYAQLYIGEGATMASESALLGTPSILVSSLASTMGNFIEMEKTYNVLFCYDDLDSVLSKTIEILNDPTSKEIWKVKRERLLQDKIDLTAFMVWFVENYPKSHDEIRNNPEVQNRFYGNKL